jgi:glucosamine--fructose-6-phosphate aminotransferase (isomerizing)
VTAPRGDKAVFDRDIIPDREERTMSHLSREIHQQPEILARLLDEQDEAAARIAAAIRERDVCYAVFAARGTSDNAARYAQYLFGALNRLPVALATPSLFSIYRTPPRLDRALVLGVSQSGQTPDIVAVVEEGRRQGAVTVAVTNSPDAPLAEAAEHILPLGAGDEQAVAATKTYTAQLAALALLGVHLAGDEERLGELRRMPDAVAETLSLEDPIAGAAQRYAHVTQCVVLGRGYNYATAFEIALKLKELTYVVAEPYSSADFRHGPVALVERGFPVIVIAPQGAVYDDVLALTRKLAGRDAELMMISGEDEALRLARVPLRLPAGLPEWLSPFTCIVPGQLLALHATLAKGYDPDHPRGLTKVTRTR